MRRKTAPCSVCGERDGRHSEWCEIGATWPIPWRGIVIAILAIIALVLKFCWGTSV